MKRALIAIAMLLLAAARAAASQNPNTARGFSADGVYQYNQVDAINTFNGGLVVTIPIGKYIAGDRLQYGFTLTYNSAVWDLEKRRLLGSPRTESVPARVSNAGMGWLLTLGELFYSDNLVYVGPDGAEHAFKSDTLHFGEDIVQGPPSTVRYARDGSYYRIRTTDTATEVVRTVDFPDGVSKEFVCVARCDTFTNEVTKFQLRRIVDAFGNFVTITRGEEPEFGLWQWTVSENIEAGRSIEHYITFIRSFDAPYTWIVKWLDIEVTPSQFQPDQAITQARRARYTFDYYEDKRVYRHVMHTAPSTKTAIQPTERTTIAVPLLRSLILPDDSRWDFQYHDAVGSEILPPGPSHGDYSTAHFDKLLERLTYPTGGAIHYTWGKYRYPRISCINPNERDPIPKASTSDGVIVRQLLKPDGDPDGEPWRYIQTYIGGTTTANTWPYVCSGSYTLRNTVVDPLGNVTENLFSILIDQENNIGGSPLDYGMPIAVTIPDPLDATRKLSTRVFQCGSTVPFDPDKTPETQIIDNAIDPGRVCTLKRSTYVRYETSGKVCNWADDDNGPSCVNANRRVASQRTVFHDDGDSWTKVDNSNFDGLGHYRESRSSGNFFDKNALGGTRPRGDLKVHRQTWNPNASFDLTNQTFCCHPLPDKPWLIELYDETSVEELTTGTGELPAKGGVAKIQYHFDERGFLKQKRTLMGASPGEFDLLTTYDRIEDTGSRWRIEERYYGGDCIGGNCPRVPTTPLPVTTPGSAGYVIHLTTRFGALEKKEYRSCDGSVLILLAERNEIDPATGLTMSTRDASGAITHYLYDELNRVKEIHPPGEAMTSFAYTKAVVSGSQFTPAAVVSTRNSSPDPPQSKWQYDPFGRVTATLQRLPNAGGSERWNRKETRYYTNGWKKEETTLGPDGSTTPNEGVTRYSAYDPFGRVLQEIHADSEEIVGTGTATPLHKTDYVYKGTRVIEKTVTGLATNSSGTGTATTKEFHDSQGRLAAVTEDSAGSQQTIYEYDSSDRLVKVTAGTQVRSFTFDNRGFLKGEKHPELGPNGVTYGEFDARGHAHQTYYGSTTSRHELDTTLSYDGAERLTLIAQPAFKIDNRPRPLKSFAYYLNPAAGAHQLGKLRQSQRFNYVYDPRATSTPKRLTITELYDYWPGNHRLRNIRLTSPDTTPVVRWTTTLSYDDLGNVSSVGYPQLKTNCQPSSCPQAGSGLSVGNRYSYGHLSEIPGYVDSITYHINGIPNRVKHRNGVTWVQEVTSRNLLRPSRIRLEGANWNTGFYRYDAAGDVAQIDGNQYVYDAVGRLLSGGGQQFSYDRHGNHTNFLGTGYLPDAGTNRLPTTVASYDLAGNVTRYKDPRQTKYEYSYEYDPFNMMRHMTAFDGQTKAFGRMFLYNASDERVAVIDYVGSKPNVRETWSARDSMHRVIRDFERLYDPRVKPPDSKVPAQHGWSWQRDYIYRATTLAAMVDANGTTHVHVDHLGTPRVTTTPTGSAGPLRVFRPFGEETVSTGDPLRLKFTGHERDDAGGDLQFGDVDYMHARYYNPFLGRFLSVDPGRDIDARAPQSWNLYAYVRNSPIGKTDPTGRQRGNLREAGTDKMNTNPCTGGDSAGSGGGCLLGLILNLDLPRPVELGVLGFGNWVTGANQFLVGAVNTVTGPVLGIEFPAMETPQPGSAMDVPGASVVRMGGNAFGGALMLPYAAEGVGFVVGGGQGFGPAAIGSMDATAAAAAEGYSILSVPGWLYGPGAQQGFQWGAASYSFLTGTPITLMESAGTITLTQELPFFIGLGIEIVQH